MSSPEEVQEEAQVVPGDKIEKDEMVGFLTSDGKIRNATAEKLYDEGMDNWASLVNGDEKFFTSFKGVGKKTAGSLVELAKMKLEEIEQMGSIPTLRDTLAAIPRVSSNTIDTLIDSGYDSYDSFRDLEAEKLQELKRIGPKLSMTIIEKVNSVREKFGIEEEPTPIEDATGVEGEEEEKEDKKGFIQKIIDWIRSLFSGKKKEESPEEDKEEEVPAEEESPEGDKEEEAPAEEEPPKEEKEEEAPVEDEVPVEEKEEEPAVEEEEKEVSEGFLHKIKNMFSGGKKDEEPPKEEKEEEPSEEEPSGEEGPSDEDETPVDEEPLAEDEVPPVKEGKEAGKGPLGLAGISVKSQEKLVSAGYHNIEEIKEAVPSDLMMIEGIGKKTAERICDAVKE